MGYYPGGSFTEMAEEDEDVKRMKAELGDEEELSPAAAGSDRWSNCCERRQAFLWCPRSELEKANRCKWLKRRAPWEARPTPGT